MATISRSINLQWIEKSHRDIAAVHVQDGGFLCEETMWTKKKDLYESPHPLGLSDLSLCD